MTTAGGRVGGSSRDRVLPTVVALAYVRGSDGGRWVPAARTLVLVRRDAGWVSEGGRFPEEIDVSEDLVRRIDLPCVRLERGRLYVSAANGEAVYVPVAPVPRGGKADEVQAPGCVRYGRLYLRPGG